MSSCENGKKKNPNGEVRARLRKKGATATSGYRFVNIFASMMTQTTSMIRQINSMASSGKGKREKEPTAATVKEI